MSVFGIFQDVLRRLEGDTSHSREGRKSIAGPSMSIFLFQMCLEFLKSKVKNIKTWRIFAIKLSNQFAMNSKSLVWSLQSISAFSKFQIGMLQKNYKSYIWILYRWVTWGTGTRQSNSTHFVIFGLVLGSPKNVLLVLFSEKVVFGAYLEVTCFDIHPSSK